MSLRTRLSLVRDEPHTAGYYLLMGVVVAVFAGLWLFEGYFLFTAWFPSLFDELTPINGVMAGGFMTLMLVSAVAALVRPHTALGPSKIVLVGTGLLGVMMPLAFVRSDPVVTVASLAVVVPIVVGIARLHPARPANIPAPRQINYPLLALTGLLAIPFVALAVDFQWSQMTLDDEVAQRWFYGGYAMYLLAVVSLTTVASIDSTTRPLLLGASVFLTAILGLVSVVYPSELHSLGLFGGGALLV